MTPSRAELESLRAWATDVAQEAGRLTLRYFRGSYDVEQKADETPVTRADREAETLIRDRISAAFPDDAILGEEFGTRSGNGRRTWVIDPIDGTKSFVSGVPLYGVLIALVDGPFAGEEIPTSRVQVGVIHVPPLDETVSAARGCGIEWNGNPTSVSSHAHLDGARIGTTDFADLHRRVPGLAARIDESAALTRTWGDAYGYLLTATGRLDAMIDPIMSPWDMGPLPVIIEEAGGRYTDLSGRSVLGTSAIASNGSLHRELIAD